MNLFELYYTNVNVTEFCLFVLVFFYVRMYIRDDVFYQLLVPRPGCELSSCFQDWIIFCEYNRPSMISLSNVCICISRVSPKKKKKKWYD